jgi:hypothetical protein
MLWDLWEALLDHCVQYLETTPPEKRTAQWMELIRAVLRDNGIRVDAHSAKDVRESAAQLRDARLPFH